ncbi:MAG: FAD-dependent protein [Candidatus Eremiobacterota bacterium]
MCNIVNLRFKITDRVDIPGSIAKTLNIPVSDISSYKILRKSVDARKKNMIYFDFSVKVYLKSGTQEVVKLNIESQDIIRKRKHTLNPVIAGSGPAGLFSALAMIKKGYKPLIIERGKKIAHRIKDVEKLWTDGILNPDSNVQFGEGGAGTFSDGKLTCRKKNGFIKEILNMFVSFGAPGEILYESKPHVGTDLIRKVVTNMRKSLEEKGAKFLFSTKLEGITVKEGSLAGVKISGTTCETDALVLATGHSARDIFELLEKAGLSMEPKDFAVGLRIEHEQELINRNQYGPFFSSPLLSPSDYILKYNDIKSGRSVYSFCMCPGGEIICAASEPEGLVVNGMSNYLRNSGKANSAIVATVRVRDFYSSSVLDGIRFQKKYEKAAFLAGGGSYVAPAQTTLSFLGLRGNYDCTSSYLRGVKFVQLKEYIPEFLYIPLRRGLEDFCKKIKGFEKSILVGIETRTSSPVRILRNDNRTALNVYGLYPAGEGAGYAGGIISASLDGMKTGEVF